LYRKYRAEKLFTGHEFLGEDWVLITNEVGKIIDTVPIHEAGESVVYYPGTLLPGFINAHCHLELSHMKGVIPKHTGLVDFLLSVLQHRSATDSLIQEAIEKAETEMIQNGIVAVGDICNQTDTLLQKQKGRLKYHNFIETSAVLPAMAKTRFENALAVYHQFSDMPYRNSIVPHAPYSVSSELFSLITSLPGNNRLCMHNQETEAENELFRTGKGGFQRLYDALGMQHSFGNPPGNSSLQQVLPHFKPESSLMLVHNLAAHDDDIAWLLKKRPIEECETSFCICAGANLYISKQLPNIPMLSDSGIPLVIGTDSLASNDELNIYHELEIIHQHFPQIPWEELFKWATLNGAIALGMNNQLGSFEKGKTPGVVQVCEGKTNRII
jgi:cytosine/adenosine deaminase-related metal-dependent hydrolase